MTIATNARDSLRQFATTMRPCIEALLQPKGEARLPANPLALPVLLEPWRKAFVSVGDQEKLLETANAILEELWESEGPWLTGHAYQAVEGWLCETTLPIGAWQPKVTLKLTWFAAAVNNFLWWLQHPSPDKPDKLEEGLRQSVDPFLHALQRAKPLGLGDLVAMHLVARRMDLLVPPRTKLPVSLAVRRNTIRTFSPVARLAALAHEGDLGQAADTPWRCLDVLLINAEGAGLRQHLADVLAQRLRTESPGAVLDVLASLDTACKPAKEKLHQAFLAFLGQVLLGLLPDRLAVADDAKAPWRPWIAGYPLQVSPARWCGRLARQVEGDDPESRWSDRVSHWLDLARGALYHWLSGRDEAALCLGLWLQGFCDDPGPLPALRRAQRLLGHTTEELVVTWLRSLRREQLGSIGEQMQNLDQELLQKADYKTLRAEQGLDDSRTPPADKQPTERQTLWNVRVYRS